MIRKMFIRYKYVILYVFFGVCTTVVNILSYWACSHLLHMSVILSAVVAWFTAVLFAYLTNRKWVFNSSNHGKCEILKEALYFYMMRIATGLIDWLGMYVLVDSMQFNDMIIKVILNVLVIVLNYIVSKLLVFNKQ